MRRAPADGYDFARKRDYRRKVWATFRESLKREHIPLANAQALLMPSVEGDEIDVALNAGFREYNLHVVDKEPAIVATLKKRYPKIHTYGVTVSRAMDRMARDGIRVACANFDLCNQISVTWAAELWAVSLLGNLPARLTKTGFRLISNREPFGVFDDTAIVAVSQLRGREAKYVTQGWKEEQVRDSALAVSQAKTMLAVLAPHDDGIVLAPETIHRLTSIYRRFMELSVNDRYRVVTTLKVLSLDTRGLPEIGRIYRPAIEFVRTETYLSTNGQTMLWSVWKIESAASLIRLHRAADAKRVAMGMTPRRFDLLYTPQ